MFPIKRNTTLIGSKGSFFILMGIKLDIKMLLFNSKLKKRAGIGKDLYFIDI